MLKVKRTEELLYDSLRPNSQSRCTEDGSDLGSCTGIREGQGEEGVR